MTCSTRPLMLLFAASFSSAGCGPDGPPLVPVSGQVTLDGDPLDGAAVTFLPEDPEPGQLGGFGKTGTDGKYTIVNSNGGDGLAVGKYKVAVSKSNFQPTTSSEEGLGAVTAADLKDELSPAYSDLSRTTLSYSVDQSGGSIDIELKSGKKK